MTGILKRLLLPSTLVALLLSSGLAQEIDWQSEQLSSVVQQSMNRLVEDALSAERSGDRPSPSADSPANQLLAPQFNCESPTEADFEILRDDHVALVKRFETGESDSLQIGGTFQDLLSELTVPASDVANTKFRLKVSRINVAENTTSARVLLFGRSHRDNEIVQLNAVWQTVWKSNNEQLILESVQVLNQEVAHLRSAQPWFRDATAAVFAGDRAFEEQISVGKNSWYNRIERFAGSNLYARHGHAIGDANGDGLDDLYVCQPGGLPNRLFLGREDGTLAASNAPGTQWLNDTKSALLVDLDNDGDQDLVVGSFVGVFICENDGTGSFAKVAQLPNVEMDVSSLSAVDYDRDGMLDVHVCVYNSDASMKGQGHGTNVYDLRSKGGTNRLFRNNSKPNQASTNAGTTWAFEDVTQSAGLTDGNERFSLAAAWEDYDNDGDQDLYIANDFGINCLYRNNAGRFENVSKELGVEDYGPGMSVGWGDFNRDGLPDLYVANMFSAAGNRVTRQEEFQSNAFGTSRESFRRFNKGNSLYAFDGQRFQEVPGKKGAVNAQWAWSSLLVDIDNDGWQDAIVANGYITGPGGGDL